MVTAQMSWHQNSSQILTQYTTAVIDLKFFSSTPKLPSQARVKLSPVMHPKVFSDAKCPSYRNSHYFWAWDQLTICWLAYHEARLQ